MKNLPQRAYRKVTNFIENRRINGIMQKQLIAGKYKRIYQYHIHKTGGTSVNMSFFNLAGDGEAIAQATVANPKHRVIVGDKIFVRWNYKLLKQGNYFYGVSHTPYHELRVPDGTFTFTILREPIARIISQYKQVVQLVDEGSDHPATQILDPQYLDTVDDFVQHLPKDLLLNQVYLFAEDYAVDTAEKVIRSLDLFFFLEDFDAGMQRMAQMLDLPLKPTHVRKSKPTREIIIHDMPALEAMMSPEIELYNRFKNG